MIVVKYILSVLLSVMSININSEIKLTFEKFDQAVGRYDALKENFDLPAKSQKMLFYADKAPDTVSARASIYIKKMGSNMFDAYIKNLAMALIKHSKGMGLSYIASNKYIDMILGIRLSPERLNPRDKEEYLKHILGLENICNKVDRELAGGKTSFFSEKQEKQYADSYVMITVSKYTGGDYLINWAKQASSDISSSSAAFASQSENSKESVASMPAKEEGSWSNLSTSSEDDEERDTIPVDRLNPLLAEFASQLENSEGPIASMVAKEEEIWSNSSTPRAGAEQRDTIPVDRISSSSAEFTR